MKRKSFKIHHSNTNIKLAKVYAHHFFFAISFFFFATASFLPVAISLLSVLLFDIKYRYVSWVFGKRYFSFSLVPSFSFSLSVFYLVKEVYITLKWYSLSPLHLSFVYFYFLSFFFFLSAFVSSIINDSSQKFIRVKNVRILK